jgi:K+-sensing histidine kinase KdpD
MLHSGNIRASPGGNITTEANLRGRSPTAVFNSRLIRPMRWSNGKWWRYLGACGVTALCTALAYPLFGYIDAANLVMVYLLGATAAGLWLGRGPAALCAISSAGAFDFFFVPPASASMWANRNTCSRWAAC